VTPSPTSLPPDHLSQSILSLRGQKVLLDADLAALYGVPTKRLNEQVKRNLERFPADFMFQLTDQEFRILKSQFATSSGQEHGGRRKLPYAFTEHGALMAATVLNSERAIEMCVYIVRAFVRLRALMTSNNAIAQKLKELERKVDTHDQAIAGILNAIRELMTPPETTKKKPIGFVHDDE
jgi:hypothetical protein